MNFAKKPLSLGPIAALSALLLALSSSPLHSEVPENSCSKEILLAYFPTAFVNQTLKKYAIPEKEWPEITRELQEKDKEIVAIVEEKASKITPNPLKDPQQRQVAVNLFRDTLYEVFSSVLKNHGITDSAKLHSMLEDVQQQKAKLFAQCLETRKSESK